MRAPTKPRAIVAILLVIAMVFPAFGQQPSSQTSKGGASSSTSTPGSAQKLPLRRVVLYKSGVGYFEHGGRVHGNEDVEIDLTSSQLDDVLKSLTALDLNGGRIVGANYNSQDPPPVTNSNRCPWRLRTSRSSANCWKSCAERGLKCGMPRERSPGG